MKMNEISITRYENNDVQSLSKKVYNFSIEGLTLRYSSCMWYYRDSNESWGDEWLKPLSFDKWRENNAMYSLYEQEEKYENYHRRLNPVCQITSYGKCKAGGISSRDISNMPVCPDDVADEAIQKLREFVKVKYK